MCCCSRTPLLSQLSSRNSVLIAQAVALVIASFILLSPTQLLSKPFWDPVTKPSPDATWLTMRKMHWLTLSNDLPSGFHLTVLIQNFWGEWGEGERCLIWFGYYCIGFPTAIALNSCRCGQAPCCSVVQMEMKYHTWAPVLLPFVSSISAWLERATWFYTLGAVALLLFPRYLQWRAGYGAASAWFAVGRTVLYSIALC